jgi:hypothetical protein
MMRLASLLTTSCLLTYPSIAHADCSWRLGWPNDERIWAVPWGRIPRDGFLTRIDCERVIDTMLGEAIRGQALLIELPTCVCVPGYDDFAQEGIRNAQSSPAPTQSPPGDSQRDTVITTREHDVRWTE